MIRTFEFTLAVGVLMLLFSTIRHTWTIASGREKLGKVGMQLTENRTRLQSGPEASSTSLGESALNV